MNPLVSGPTGRTCLVRWLKKNKTNLLSFALVYEYYLTGNYQWKKGSDRNEQERFISVKFSILFEALCLFCEAVVLVVKWDLGRECAAEFITAISDKNEKGCVPLLSQTYKHLETHVQIIYQCIFFFFFFWHPPVEISLKCKWRILSLLSLESKPKPCRKCMCMHVHTDVF